MVGITAVWPQSKFGELLIEENTKRLIQWWAPHIEKDISPDPVNNENLMILYPDAKDGSVVEATPQVYDLYEELVKVRNSGV